MSNHMLCEEKTESTAITRHSTIPTNTPCGFHVVYLTGLLYPMISNHKNLV